MKTMIFKLEMHRTYFFYCIVPINIKITIGEKEGEVRPLDSVASKAQEQLDWRLTAAGQINTSSGCLAGMERKDPASPSGLSFD